MLALRRERGSEIVTRFDIVRINSQRLFVVRDRLFESAERLQRIAQIVVSLRKARPNNERFLVMQDRFVMKLYPGQRNAEMNLGVGRLPVGLGAPRRNRSAASPKRPCCSRISPRR